MNPSQLEAWAVSKAAQNKNFHSDWKPVILYRNGEANGMGALFPSSGGTHVLTAGHLFWKHMPPCSWTYAVLKPELGARLPLVRAQPFPGNPKADVGICVPGSILQVSSPLPNFFYQGAKWGGEMQVNIREPKDGSKTLISTISGERLTSLGDVVYDNAPYEILDYASMSGESGTVLWDEADAKTAYVLKGDSLVVAKHLRKLGLCQSGKTTLALRLSMK